MAILGLSLAEQMARVAPPDAAFATLGRNRKLCFFFPCEVLYCSESRSFLRCTIINALCSGFVRGLLLFRTNWYWLSKCLFVVIEGPLTGECRCAYKP